jgi:hypothetical protein
MTTGACFTAAMSLEMEKVWVSTIGFADNWTAFPEVGDWIKVGQLPWLAV